MASNPPESVYDPSDTTEAAERVDFNERVVSNAAGLADIHYIESTRHRSRLLV